MYRLIDLAIPAIMHSECSQQARSANAHTTEFIIGDDDRLTSPFSDATKLERQLEARTFKESSCEHPAWLINTMRVPAENALCSKD